VASEALEKFRRSMAIGYMEWHDGIGYDLDALAALPPEDRQTAEDLLVARRAADWRDIEALDRLGSPRALLELEKALRAKSIDVRTLRGPRALSLRRIIVAFRHELPSLLLSIRGQGSRRAPRCLPRAVHDDRG